jgi:phosphoserine phosphatase
MEIAGQHYRVVSFDLDGTLLRGTTVCRYLGAWLGESERILEIERRYHARRATSAEMADGSAPCFRGCSLGSIAEALERAPWIAGIGPCVAALRDAGVEVLVGAVTWSFAGEWLRDRYGFAGVCGSEMGVDGGALTGVTARYFDEYDKLDFVRAWCSDRDIGMHEVAAVGDSLSDVPLFRSVGMAVALNAREEARAVATHTIDTDDARDLLPLLLGAPAGAGARQEEALAR